MMKLRFQHFVREIDIARIWIFTAVYTYIVIKCQVLSYHVYVVWEVKERFLESVKVLILAHTLYYHHDINDITLESVKM